MLLEVSDLSAGYLGSSVLEHVSLRVERGITLVLGPNGAGKSTLIRSVAGTLRPVAGSLRLDGVPLETLRAHQVALQGVATSPERARLFTDLKVVDNLRLGADLARRRGEAVDWEKTLATIFRIFPGLPPILSQRAGQLSGGQQQAVAIARALAAQPRLLLLDEPTTGLHPVLVRDLLGRIQEIAKDLPVLLTEQNALQTIPLAREVHLLEAGRIVLSGPPERFLADDRVRRAYLGEGAEPPPLTEPPPAAEG